jgi:hypothetical protein
MKDSKTKSEESTRLTYTGLSFLISFILRDVSFTEVVSVCRVAFREPIHLRTYVRDEGGDGESSRSETPSLA